MVLLFVTFFYIGLYIGRGSIISILGRDALTKLVPLSARFHNYIPSQRIAYGLRIAAAPLLITRFQMPVLCKVLLFVTFIYIEQGLIISKFDRDSLTKSVPLRVISDREAATAVQSLHQQDLRNWHSVGTSSTDGWREKKAGTWGDRGFWI